MAKAPSKRGSAPGERRGGRQKGTPNAVTKAVAAKLEAIGCDPIVGMAKIAMGTLECTLCHGKGKHLDPSGTKHIACTSCKGSKRETVSLELQARMYAELATYVAPKRKATDFVEDDSATEERILDNPAEVARRIALILGLAIQAKKPKGD